MQAKRSVTVDRVVDLCSPQHSVLSFVLCLCSPMSLKLLISWVMSLLIGALGSRACLSCVFVVHSFFRVCIACAVCAAERDYWARVATRNLFGALDSCVLSCLVFGGFLDLGEQRVLLVVGMCRARLLHTITVLFHSQTCQQGRSDQASEAPLCRAKLERHRGATLRLNKYTVTEVTSRFNAASERFVVISVLGWAVAFLQIFMDRGVCIRQKHCRGLV